MFKRFNEWIGLKEKLHSNNPKAPLVKERDLWWISLGELIKIKEAFNLLYK
jgi:hypothetical protein